MTSNPPEFPQMSRQSPAHGWPQNPKSKIDGFGIQPPLDDITREFQPQLRKFAVEVMRPIGQRLGVQLGPPGRHAPQAPRHTPVARGP